MRPLSRSKATDQTTRARLYDADGQDREVDPKPGLTGTLKEHQLLWIDLAGRGDADLETVAGAVGIDSTLRRRLAADIGHADLTQYQDHIHLVIESMDQPAESYAAPVTPEPQEIHLVAGRNWVLTVHAGPVAALERIDKLTQGETRYGALDAGGFMAAIVDEVLSGYLALAEAIEQEIDRLDERALRTRPRDDVLARIVAIRRQIGSIRRTLTPHRVAFAALARPEMELHDELGQPWPGLTERLDRAIESIEGLRDLLLGTYDIHMGRAAQEANEIMKRLTLLSAVLLPAVVLAGIMGMNFSLEFFKDSGNFQLVVGAMIVFGVTLLGAARWRGWL
ncbi:MAG TPA: CorA family divalent cation transporter [Candidatus Limnocylindrales bacterium]|nr:CorA family divalent cation transporter [Candidatus Limnocylindrales bacterium]